MIVTNLYHDDRGPYDDICIVLWFMFLEQVRLLNLHLVRKNKFKDF